MVCPQILPKYCNFPQLIHIIGALCEQLAPEFPCLAPYRGMIERIESAQRSRNKYAHNAVIANEEVDQVEVSFAFRTGHGSCSKIWRLVDDLPSEY